MAWELHLIRNTQCPQAVLSPFHPTPAGRALNRHGGAQLLTWQASSYLLDLDIQKLDKVPVGLGWVLEVVTHSSLTAEAGDRP